MSFLRWSCQYQHDYQNTYMRSSNPYLMSENLIGKQSWLPLWLPINIISEIAVPISLSLRLFANVLSGTVMMALVYGLLSKIAIVWPAALHVYFDLFSGAIQTYVFCMLTMTYVNQQMETE